VAAVSVEGGEEMNKCVICGKEFKPKLKTQITCSEECRQERVRQTSREYMRRRASTKQSPVYERRCEECGKLFTTPLKNKVTCSSKCQAERTKRKSREWHREHPKEEKAYTKTCPVCGTKFETKNVKKIYCTTKCYNVALRRRNREYMANERAKDRAEKVPENLKSNNALADAEIEARAAGMTYGQWQARRYAYGRVGRNTR
jgi:predicted nucleic acid-binding Zn ribbon protein